MSSSREDKSITLLKDEVQTLINALSSNVTELESVIASRPFTNTPLRPSNQLIRDIQSQLASKNSLSEETWKHTKEIIQNELTNVMLMLQHVSIVIAMKNIIASYKKQHGDLREAEQLLQIILENITGNCNTIQSSIDAKTNESFDSLHTDITNALQQSKIYSNNHFEDIIDFSHDMQDVTIESLNTLKAAHIKLETLHGSISNMINTLNTEIETTKKIINAKKNQLIKNISDSLHTINAHLEKIEIHKEAMRVIEINLKKEFSGKIHLTLLHHNIEECKNEYRKLHADFHDLDLTNIRATKLLTIQNNFHSRSDTLTQRVATASEVLSTYLEKMKAQATEENRQIQKLQDEKRTKESTIQHAKQALNNQMLMLEKNLISLNQSLQDLAEPNQDIYVLDLQLKRYHIDLIQSYYEMKKLNDIEDFRQKNPGHLQKIKSAQTAQVAYQIHLNEMKKILQEIGQKNTSLDELNNIKNNFDQKEKAFITDAQNIETHVNNMSEICKYRRNVLTRTKQDFLDIQATLATTIENIPIRTKTTLATMKKDHDQAIAALEKDRLVMKAEKNMLLKNHAALIAQIRNDFHTDHQDYLDHLQNQINEDTQSASSQILSWFACWLPFVKNTKRDNLLDQQSKAQQFANGFNQYCDYLTTIATTGHDKKVRLTQIKNELYTFSAPDKNQCFFNNHCDNVKTLVDSMSILLFTHKEHIRKMQLNIQTATQQYTLNEQKISEQQIAASKLAKEHAARVNLFVTNILPGYTNRPSPVIEDNRHENSIKTLNNSFQKPNGSLFNNFVNTITNTTHNLMQILNNEENQNAAAPSALQK